MVLSSLSRWPCFYFMGENWSYPTWASSPSNFLNSNLIVSKYSFHFIPTQRNYLPSSWIIAKLLHQLISFAFILNFSLSSMSHKCSHSAQVVSTLKDYLPLSFFSVSLDFHDSIFYFSFSISECSFISPFYILLALLPKYNISQHLSLLFLGSFHFLFGYFILCVQ